MEHDYTTSQTPAKGVQVGLEPTPTPNAATAATQASIPGFGGNLIEVDIVTNKNKSAVYTSKAYPANADGKQRPGAVVEYSSEFSVGEGIGGCTNVLPNGYLAAEFLESTGSQYIDTGFFSREFLDSELGACIALGGDSKSSYNGCFRSGGFSLQFWVDLNVNSAGGVFFSSVALNKTVANGRVFHTIELKENSIKVDGEKIEQNMPLSNRVTINSYDDKFYLFSRYNAAQQKAEYYKTRMKYFKSRKDGKMQAAFVPAISVKGQPCMYDTVSKQSFLNSGTGAFIVGMTLAQARKLGQLPAGGGTLKVSLPSNYLENEGVVNAISEANAKGWNIEVTSTWDASGASATFALRRIWVRKTQTENGNYLAADGTRWAVESCVAMYNVDGSEPDAHGYEPFRSVDAAVAYWELEPYVYPEEEFSQDIKYN